MSSLIPRFQRVFQSRALWLASMILTIGGYAAFQAYGHSSGMTGVTQKPGTNGGGCSCHCATSNSSTSVSIATSATSFAPSTAYTFTVSVSNSGESSGGVDVAVYSGTLAAGTDGLSLSGSELTHSSPKTLPATWTFTYTTPSSAGYDTIYATGNAVNGDGSNGGGNCTDQWNNSAKFIVHVVSSSLTKAVTISRSGISLGNVRVGRRKADSLKINSTGTGALTVSASAMKVGANFSSYPSNSSRSINAAASEIDSVIFSPISRGSFTDSLLITTNADATSDQHKAVYVTGQGIQGAFSGPAGPLAFGNLRVGRTATQSYIFQNNGDDSLFLQTPAISGTGFTISTQVSRLNLAPNEFDTVVVQFAPTGKTTYSGSLTFAAQTGVTTPTISLSGTGTQPQFQGATTVALGGSRPGQTLASSYQIHNTSTNDTLHLTNVRLTQTGSRFTLGAYDSIIPPQGTGIFHINYVPTSEAVDNATLQFSSDDPASSSVSVAVSARGILPHMAVADKDTVDFGSVKVGTPATHDFVVLNTGTDALTIFNANVSPNPPFSLVGNAGLVQPSTQGVVTVQFLPTSVGTFTGKVIVNGDDPANAADTIYFKASSNNSALSVPPNLDFGSVAVPSSGSQTLTMQNAGGASVRILSYKLSQPTPVFTFTDTAAHNVAGNGSASIILKFTPVDAANYGGTLTITTDDATTPVRIVSLAGKGTKGSLSVTPSSIDFGSVDTGKTLSQRIVIKNTGTATVSITGASATGADIASFIPTGLPVQPVQIAAGDSLAFSVTFAPHRAGLQQAGVTLATSDKPIAIALQGMGTIPQQSGYVALNSAASEVSLRIAPNPVRNASALYLSVVMPGEYSIALFDAVGRELSTSATGYLTPGEYNFGLNVGKLSSGRYFVRISDQEGKSIEGRVSVEH